MYLSSPSFLLSTLANQMSVTTIDFSIIPNTHILSGIFTEFTEIMQNITIGYVMGHLSSFY